MLDDQENKQHQILKTIIDKELQEIDEEMATLDNSDIATVIEFHTKHGIRDAEERRDENGTTELEFPYDTSDELKKSMNALLLNLEVLLQYFYRACYFGTAEEQNTYRNNILAILE
ncbi:MAG: hypothetical protein KZQ70_13490 [gamma proteobacterium symbiont of Lucinoma myriamae]|nr:hypothetical protein [gamma proteobacterium symbiont of Lucinoma myriamae]MCU7818510.1 hypothetical protein [gamma proteobacterium symbiont of Lucinoma myriamae]